ncbi:MAG: YbjQ family protein, partial [Rhodobacteraceae bacterium]|nr:YbjQ family protein [Paracoccaceae bacterium]
TSLCERARDDAFRQMIDHAAQVGANAVIGVRYDANEIAAGVTEVLCYGTAVFVEPKPAAG